MSWHVWWQLEGAFLPQRVPSQRARWPRCPFFFRCSIHFKVTLFWKPWKLPDLSSCHPLLLSHGLVFPNRLQDLKCMKAGFWWIRKWGPYPGYCNKMEENGGIMLINCHSPSELGVVSQQKCQTKSGSSMFKPFINGWVWNRAGNHGFCPQNIGVSKRNFIICYSSFPPNIELGSPLCHWGAVPLSQWGD